MSSRRSEAGHRSTSRPSLIHRVGAAVALALALAALSACGPPSELVLDGRGWGHGRGMGQWGAYGYAIDHGWTETAILDHFYGGTSTFQRPDNPMQRVFLTAQEGRDLAVSNSRGLLETSADGYARRRTALLVRRVDSTRFRVFSGDSCDGPWSEWPALVTASEIGVRVAPVAGLPDDATTKLGLCGSTGTRYYRGDLLAVHAAGTIQTVNRVDTENLVRSVITREVSPSWSDAGGGAGATAVRAQAVATRSYALAGDTRFQPWATTCDNTRCQVYPGYGFRANGSSTVVKVEDPRTDWATGATGRQVRRFPSGAVARTEFFPSTGGWTAGGTFPAVPDEGDDTTANPSHTWTTTISRATLEGTFDRRQGRDVGTYEGVDILQRNGLGADGGRVLSMRVRFSAVDVTLTGDDFRALFGLRSNWFTPR